MSENLGYWGKGIVYRTTKKQLGMGKDGPTTSDIS
jgi:hypothetical protein